MVFHYRSLFRPIVRCSLNECFSFHKIWQNIALYVNCKRIIQKFCSILNLLHLLTSYLFNKKNSGVAGGFRIMYEPSISKEPRGAFRAMSSIYDRALCEQSQQPQLVFRKPLHLRYSTGLRIRL